jgi:predicted DNA-binding transcriptional regulator
VADLITIILSGFGLLLASIPIRFAMDLAGDLYKEILQEKWIKWIRHLKNPKIVITTLKSYIEQDIKRMK